MSSLLRFLSNLLECPLLPLLSISKANPLSTLSIPVMILKVCIKSLLTLLVGVGTRSDDVAGDSLSYHDDMAFSTADMDNDLHMSNCAEENGGGWWFNSCSSSNLNGIYQSTGWYAQRPVSWATATDTADTPDDTDHPGDSVGDSVFGNGVFWFTLKEDEFYSLKRVEMKIRPSE